MDLSFSPDITDLAALVRDICARTVTTETHRELDGVFGPGTESGGSHREAARLHAAAAKALDEAGIAEAMLDLGPLADAAVERELGRALASVPLGSAVLAGALLGSGEPASSIAVALPSDGTITQSPDGTLSGWAHGIDWAPIAEPLLVAGTDSDGQPAVWEVPLDRSAASCLVERLVPVDFSCSGRVTLDGASPARTVRSGQDAAEAVEAAELRRRLHLAAYQWGVVERALDTTAAYATEREQFGRAIGTFQAVAARLADGLIDVDAVRLTTLRAAFELADGPVDDRARDAVATAHYWACEAGHRLAHTSVHVHGGVGLDRENDAHRYFLAAKAGEFRLGGATRQLLDLGSLLAAAGDPWEAQRTPQPSAPASSA